MRAVLFATAVSALASAQTCTERKVQADPVLVELAGYLDSAKLCWHIECARPNDVGVLSFSWMDTEPENDWLYIDGFEYSGNTTVPPPVHFDGSVTFVFGSDKSVNKGGFSATARCTPCKVVTMQSDPVAVELLFYTDNMSLGDVPEDAPEDAPHMSPPTAGPPPSP
ncbi:hypothetical protein DIPPA_57052, partial [Diplonema papillatum]